MGNNAIFSKNNGYILLITFSQLLDSFLYGFNHNETFSEIKLIKFESGDDLKFPKNDFSNHILIHRLFFYIGTFILGFFFTKIENNYFKKDKGNKIENELNGQVNKIIRESNCSDNNIQNELNDIDKESKCNVNKMQNELNANNNKDLKEVNNNNKKFKYNLIYNDLEANLKTDKLLNYFLLTIVIWIIIEKLIDSYFVVLQDLDFWMIELLIISILYYKFNHKEIHIHHIFAIILSIISSFFKIGTIILSFQDDTKEKYYDDIPDCDNYSGHLPIIYKNNPGLYIPFGILIYFVLIFMRACVYTAFKYYIEYKFITPSKIITSFGIMGTIICFLMCFISTIFECNEKINIFKYICKVPYHNKYYFEHFIPFFNNFNVEIGEIFKEIGFIIFGFITFFSNKYFSLLVIRELSPVEVIFSVPILYIFQKSIAFLYTRISEGEFYMVNNIYKINKFYLDMSGDIISLFGFLIYFEVIAIRCCGCSDNIKENVSKRAQEEILDITRDLGSTLYQKIDQENSEIDNSMNENAI